MKYIKISIVLNKTIKPPYFIGSQIRGAFGYSLKESSCINPSFNCKGCFCTSTCNYYQFYEKENVTHKYRFDFKLSDDRYAFNLYLLEENKSHIPNILISLEKMLTDFGLGDRKIKDDDFVITVEENQKEFVAKDMSGNIRITLQTPLRIKKNNRFVRDNSLELIDIIKSIYQRREKLLGGSYRTLDFEAKWETTSKDLKYKELTRRSNRQRTTMNLGGITGTLEVKNLDKESCDILQLGEIIGVGKSTVFGLGKIKIEDMG
ncbi:MAG: CRISPR system precrRNA processing endoribonuclease RAMP protein Cas6 [Campylobacterota bacterium]|nr:CRISPR system precrRNA processing endoribonuclease RAMP protein Cas6 [Campylobacterota bacterium]